MGNTVWLQESTPIQRIMEAAKVGRWDKWVRVFVHNVVTVAALDQVWEAGNAGLSYYRCRECKHLEHKHFDICVDGQYINDDGLTCYPCDCGYRLGR